MLFEWTKHTLFSALTVWYYSLFDGVPFSEFLGEKLPRRKKKIQVQKIRHHFSIIGQLKANGADPYRMSETNQKARKSLSRGKNF